MEHPLVVGVDFGTESARALLVDVSTGEEVAVAEFAYPSGVIDGMLPSGGRQLAPAWALQDPQDYLTALRKTVREVLASSSADPAAVIGIGIDTTACTVIPALADGTPLKDLAEYRNEPHAWAKLWKHHAAQPQADRINTLAADRGGMFLPRYGGRLSSEWLLPKALQILDEAPQVFAAADRIIEAQDWIVWQLTGHEARASAVAGYKGTFRTELADGDAATGYPPAEFLAALHPDFASVLGKLASELHQPGARAGGLRAEWAAALGLPAGIAVATGNMDAQVAVAACGATGPGRMVLVMGTSVCNLLQSVELHDVEGMSGVVRDAIVPGLWAYEAGQAGVGDMFGWFVRNSVPSHVEEAAAAAGRTVFEWLEQLAAQQVPGQSGVVALDWWNGNRSVLVDANLSGVIVGYTLATRAEDVYRALLESAAYGQRMIIEAFESAGVTVDDIVACGGLPGRSPLLMQLLADITNREIRISASTQTAALGAALHAAVAAGSAAGGFDSIADASNRFSRFDGTAYLPRPEVAAAYDELFADYRALHEHFGRDEVALMHRLRARTIAAHAGR